MPLLLNFIRHAQHPRRMCQIFACALFFLPLVLRADELPVAVSTALKNANIALPNVSVVIQDLQSGQYLLRHNDAKPMNPASTMKLLTTYAALELLGPAYSWQTDALSTAPVVDGKLMGDLYLRGSGDPSISLEQFATLLRQLHIHGIRQIAGDLILDRSAFSVSAHDPAAFDNQPLRPYNAGPDALLVNLKSISFTLHADKAHKTVTIVQETPTEGVRIENQLKASDDACGDWREKLKITASDDTLEFTGKFPLACDRKALHIAPWAANVQVGRLFRALWHELGGEWAGAVRDGVSPPEARRLASLESPPLADIVRQVNKYSNNVMARQIFLRLGSAEPLTEAAAQRRVKAWLTEKQLSMSELVLDNGSGLSRRERISANGLAQLLYAAWRSPVMSELMSSLPIAGTDGTMKKRLAQRNLAGQAHLKTGYLENVRAIAGYVLDNKGKRYGVVFLINDAHSSSGKAAMDALLQWLIDR